MKRLARQTAQMLGLEVRRSGPASRPDLRLSHYLAQEKIEQLIDVGANRGQFAELIFSAGYDGEIVSIEAMPTAHGELVDRARNSVHNWRILPAMALSATSGTTTFHVNSSDATSSLLAASDAARLSIPGITPNETILVQTKRLDDLVDELDLAAKRSFLKIDVQGGEGLVLEGAEKALDHVAGLVVELSLSELYQGQPLAMDILPALITRGFEIFDIAEAYRDSSSHRLQQIDVVLFHPQRSITL
jgi:FkbM family methyltransferase